MSDRDYYLGFSVFPGIGAGRFSLLYEQLGSAKAAWEASEDELADVLKTKLTEDFLRFREAFDIASYKRILLSKKVSFMTLEDEEYPQKLRNLEKPPFVLYIKGDKKILRFTQDDKVIGVVGTRKVTSYGRRITEQFTRELVEYGCLIVSGLALGVDAIAHQVTVESGGRAIAILGCGVDCCYPTANKTLYDQIVKSDGAIISEYPLGASPSKGSFPARNRIIAALSDGLLVTEGAEDSGSLITAEAALDLGRRVFAIPGPVTSSLSRGPLRLIRKGAMLVTSGEEILQEFQMSNVKFPIVNKREVKGDTLEEQKVIDCLQNEDLSFDEIVKKTQISARTLGTILSVLELHGKIHARDNVFSLS